MKQCKYCGRNRIIRTTKQIGDKVFTLVSAVGTPDTCHEGYWGAYRLSSFCSSECQKKYNKIMRKIKQQKYLERIMRPELTPEQSKNLRRIRDVLNNC